MDILGLSMRGAFLLSLPVDILDGKRTLSDSRLWQEMLNTANYNFT